jgi:hypothetical protein
MWYTKVHMCVFMITYLHTWPRTRKQVTNTSYEPNICHMHIIILYFERNNETKRTLSWIHNILQQCDACKTCANHTCDIHMFACIHPRRAFIYWRTYMYTAYRQGVHSHTYEHIHAYTHRTVSSARLPSTEDRCKNIILRRTYSSCGARFGIDGHGRHWAIFKKKIGGND